jgi:manganese transport protein
MAKFMSVMRNLGPGMVITAAFIGPGTVTVCLIAGNHYGFQLLWVMLFACIATIILQEMAARLGLITGGGLTEAIHKNIQSPIIKRISMFLIATGILLGNTAYEAGNISGTLIGMRFVLGSSWPDLLGNTLIYCIIASFLYKGTFASIEKLFVLLVGIMSMAFCIAAFLVSPDISLMMKGFFTLTFPQGSLLTLIGLIGTTVVPYNLFLHPAIVAAKWKDAENLTMVRWDTVIAIAAGGLISVFIIITGAGAHANKITQITDLSRSFETIYGTAGRYLMGIGIFAAGFTSAVTAPLAASVVAQGIFKWDREKDLGKIRMVWLTVLTAGFIFASLGYKPVEVIRIAQFANGLLLPVIAFFLLWVVNNRSVMGAYKNNALLNTGGIIVLAVTLILGIKGIISLF